MKNNPLHILTNGWGERFLAEISHGWKNGFQVTTLWKDLREEYNDYTSFLKLRKYWNHFPLVHMNCWFDIFYLFRRHKENKIIFESHALHPGLSNMYARKIIESPRIRMMVRVFWWAFNFLFRRNIKNVDIYLVSTPGFLESAKKIRSDAVWLPNPVYMPETIQRINTLSLNGEYVNIFYPTGLRSIKNPKAAFELIMHLKEIYKDIRIYIFRPSMIPFSLKDEFYKLEKNIVWLESADQVTMRKYYSHDWDLVIWSLYWEKPYAILNMVELEAMAYSLPIIAIDHYEILKYSLAEIETLSKKLINDQEFRRRYTEKNLAYIQEIHSSHRVRKKYISLLKTCILP